MIEIGGGVGGSAGRCGVSRMMRMRPWLVLAPVGVEARGWAGKGASTLAETTGGAGARVASRSGSRPVLGVWMLLLLVYAQDVAVVAFSSARVGEDGVGFGDLGEARGGVGVGFVDVGVGLAGEGVELSGGWFVSHGVCTREFMGGMEVE